ncbi:MAG: hypothetical protein ABI969_07615 [bacterium]
MFSTRSGRTVLLPALLSILCPLAAHAQESQLFTWTGRVDREVRLEARGSRVFNSVESSLRSRARFAVSSAIPAREGTIRVETNAGRGNVEVVQQPNAQNGYSAVIRIVDDEGGADTYRVTAYWESADNGGYGRGNRGRGRGNDRNNNGINDRREDRDRRENRDNRQDNRDNRDDRDSRIGRDNYPLLQWMGDVDSDIQLVWRNGTVRVEQGSGGPPVRVRSTVSGAVRNQLPGTLQLNVRDGRGRVDVIQNPSAQNGYTGIIRISDPQSGYGHYNFDATWRP